MPNRLASFIPQLYHHLAAPSHLYIGMFIVGTFPHYPSASLKGRHYELDSTPCSLASSHTLWPQTHRSSIEIAIVGSSLILFTLPSALAIRCLPSLSYTDLSPSLLCLPQHRLKFRIADNL